MAGTWDDDLELEPMRSSGCCITGSPGLPIWAETVFNITNAHVNKLEAPEALVLDRRPDARQDAHVGLSDQPRIPERGRGTDCWTGGPRSGAGRSSRISGMTNVSGHGTWRTSISDSECAGPTGSPWWPAPGRARTQRIVGPEKQFSGKWQIVNGCTWSQIPDAGLRCSRAWVANGAAAAHLGYALIIATGGTVAGAGNLAGILAEIMGRRERVGGH